VPIKHGRWAAQCLLMAHFRSTGLARKGLLIGEMRTAANFSLTTVDDLGCVKAYASYYNRARTHLSLKKDAPLPRSIERIGRITSIPILGGLHHQYCRT
jgi:hypothetical protein